MKFCHGIAEGVAEKARGVGVTHFSQENVYYRPQTKFAKVMFLHLSVSHSVHRGGLHRGVGRPPAPHRTLRDTVNERAVRILLKCILV